MRLSLLIVTARGTVVVLVHPLLLHLWLSSELLRARPGKGAFNSATQTALTKTARWLLPIVLRNDRDTTIDWLPTRFIHKIRLRTV